MTYIVEFQNSNLLVVEPSATLDKWCTYYSAYVMHAFSDFLSHDGYIYYINLYRTDDVSMCGDAYKDRVVFFI